MISLKLETDNGGRMGGLGSGRHYRFGAADCTDEYRRLDVRRWQRDGLLNPGDAFSTSWSRNGEAVASINVRTETDQVILSYRHRRNGGDWKDEEYPVRLEWTPCTYGGRRAWFLCPAVGCGRRVAYLHGGTIFACRQCHRLAYRSQRENADDRAVRRADKIRARLGWPAGIMNGAGGKPKGMRWQTFWRLSAQHDAAVRESLAGAMRRFGIKIEV
jgi:hypothetical protein